MTTVLWQSPDWTADREDDVLAHITRSGRGLLRGASSSTRTAIGSRTRTLVLEEEESSKGMLSNLCLQTSFPNVSSIYMGSRKETVADWPARFCAFVERNLLVLKSHLNQLQLEPPIYSWDDTPISGCPLAVGPLASVARLASLQQLNAELDPELPAGSLSSLSMLTQLTRLALVLPDQHHPCVHSIASAASRLRALELQLSRTSAADIAALTSLKHLKSLVLQAPAGQDGLCAQLVQSFSSFQHLTHLTLNPRASDKATPEHVQLEAVTRRNITDKRQQVLELRAQHSKIEQRLQRELALLEGLQSRLQILRQHADDVRDKRIKEQHREQQYIINNIASITQLRSLDLHGNSSEGLLLGALTALQQLTHLGLFAEDQLYSDKQHFYMLSSQQAQHLPELPHLQSLHAGFQHPDAARQLEQMSQLAECCIDMPNQRPDDFDDFHVEVDTPIPLTGSVQVNTYVLPALDIARATSLECRMVGYEADVVAAVMAAGTALQALHLDDNGCGFSLDEQFMRAAADLPGLLYLRLTGWYTMYGTEGSPAIDILASGCKQLQRLTLDSLVEPVAASSVEGLLRLPGLRVLRMLGCKTGQVPSQDDCEQMLVKLGRLDVDVEVVGEGIKARMLAEKWKGG